MTDDAKLKAYLKTLGKNLKPLPEHDIREILAEIESLAFDATDGKTSGESLDEVLGELGAPEELAENYKSHLLEGKPLPLALRIVRGTAKGASKWLMGLTFLVGYGASLIFILVAIAKPFYPDMVGIWYGGGDAIIVGYPGAGSGLDELMGYWLIPFGLGVGTGLFFLTRKILKFMK